MSDRNIRTAQESSETLYWHMWHHIPSVIERLAGEQPEIRLKAVIWNPSNMESEGGPEIEKMRKSFEEIVNNNTSEPVEDTMDKIRHRMDDNCPQSSDIQSNSSTDQNEVGHNTIHDISRLIKDLQSTAANSRIGLLVLGVDDKDTKPTYFGSNNGKKIKGVRYLVNPKSDSPSKSREYLKDLASNYTSMQSNRSGEYASTTRAQELAALYPGCNVTTVQEATLYGFKALESLPSAFDTNHKDMGSHSVSARDVSETRSAASPTTRAAGTIAYEEDNWDW
ncbi:uncharacterized protein L201_002228 [Kwoniella dendrophila CBS 6074]|uniref:Uncharacterized protein n=1 Tax=Kwoniella dendrophila CBS 6074 TaxID=1295534 RepID=A0AAX4JRH5_9TREE